MAFRRRGFTRRRFARSSNALRRVWIPSINSISGNDTPTTITIATPSLFTSTGTNQKYAATVMRIRGFATWQNSGNVGTLAAMGIRKIDFDEIDDGADPASATYAIDEDLLYWQSTSLRPISATIEPAGAWHHWEIDIKAKRRMALEEVLVLDISTPNAELISLSWNLNCLFHAP